MSSLETITPSSILRTLLPKDNEKSKVWELMVKAATRSQLEFVTFV